MFEQTQDFFTNYHLLVDIWKMSFQNKFSLLFNRTWLVEFSFGQ